MMIMLPLVILLFITIFSIIFGATFTSLSVDTFISNDSIINGTTTVIDLGGENIYFSIDPLVGATIWIAGLIILGALWSIQFLGSGLGPMGVKTIVFGTFYGIIWIMLSVYASPLIISIPIFGWLTYITLTIIFAIGVGKQISGSGI